jgi:hypothetical protein
MFNGASRRVDAGSALNWLKQGWALFIANPGVWIAMMVIVIVIYIGLAIVPWFGPLAAHLLTPVLAAGMLLACQEARARAGARNQRPFRRFPAAHGGAADARRAVHAGHAGAVRAGDAARRRRHGRRHDDAKPLAAGIAFGGVALAGLLWLLLSVPIVMAIWFAPALVIFNAMQPVDALKASFNACLKNVVGFWSMA